MPKLCRFFVICSLVFAAWQSNASDSDSDSYSNSGSGAPDDINDMLRTPLVGAKTEGKRIFPHGDVFCTCPYRNLHKISGGETLYFGFQHKDNLMPQCTFFSPDDPKMVSGEVGCCSSFYSRRHLEDSDENQSLEKQCRMCAGESSCGLFQMIVQLAASTVINTTFCPCNILLCCLSKQKPAASSSAGITRTRILGSP